jgi:hypothetical protein
LYLTYIDDNIQSIQRFKINHAIDATYIHCFILFLSKYILLLLDCVYDCVYALELLRGGEQMGDEEKRENNEL